VFRVWRRLLGTCDKAVLEALKFDEDEQSSSPRPVEVKVEAAERKRWSSLAPIR
jgi:hypothetical protein